MTTDGSISTAIFDIAAVLRDAVSSGDVPGVVACAANRDGDIVSGIAGYADCSDHTPLRADSLFFLASMTKAVTTVALMQLVEQGRVALDDPAADHVPRLADVQVLDGFDEDGAPRLRNPRTTMTLRHLLAHTAGFAYPQWHADIKRYIEWSGVPDVLTYREHALDLPLVSDPGTCWHYGINTEFVGKIVEAVSGQRLDHYFQDHIFHPLGMASTYYDIPAGQAGRVAAVHVRNGEGLAPIALTLPEYREFYPGGVGLFGTASDYLRLTRMLLNGGELDGQRLLSAQSVAAMGTNQLGGAAMPPMRSVDSFWSHDVDPLMGDDAQWGLGFLLNSCPGREGRAPFSMSWAGACNSFYWIDRARGVTGVFMSSIVPFCDARALAAFHAFEAATYTAL